MISVLVYVAKVHFLLRSRPAGERSEETDISLRRWWRPK